MMEHAPVIRLTYKHFVEHRTVNGLHMVTQCMKNVAGREETARVRLQHQKIIEIQRKVENRQVCLLSDWVQPSKQLRRHQERR